MIGAPFSSFGISAAFALEFAVKACSNSLWAVVGVHVPAGVAARVHFFESNSGPSTSSEPLWNRVALLSVGSPRMKMTFGFFTPQAATQLTRPWPMTLPTVTLLNDT